MINQQQPSPRLRGGSGELAVHSIFYTIQGEGPLAGRPAVFVRLYGCNLQCPACDTDYTSSKNMLGPAPLVDRIAELYAAPTRPLVVITGGEPLRQNIAPFIAELQGRGMRVQIETNGTLPPSSDHGVPLDWSRVEIVCSPKTGRINKRLLPLIVAYKYIVAADYVSDRDGLPTRALDHPALPQLARPPDAFRRDLIYVQPEDPDPEGMHLAACMESVYRFGYTLSLQQHKIIGVR